MTDSTAEYKCNKCGEDKTFDEMAKNNRRASGLATCCKKCKRTVYNKGRSMEEFRKVHTHSHERFMSEISDFIKENYIILNKYTGHKNPLYLYRKDISEIYKIDRVNRLKRAKTHFQRKLALNPTMVFWKEVKIKNRKVYDNFILEEYDSEYLRKKSGSAPRALLRCKEYDLLYEISSSALLGGTYPNILSCLDKTELFKRKLKEVNKRVTVCDDSIYTTARTGILVSCNGCGKIKPIEPVDALKGCGICSCSAKIDPDEIIRRVNNTSKYKVKLLNEYKGATSDLKLQCLNCGDVYIQKTCYAIKCDGCRNCRDGRSKGELLIQKYLEFNNIKFETEYKYTDCINEQPLPFDFYLPDRGILIEFDGEQHFMDKEFFGGLQGITERMTNDNIKNEYCVAKDINLLRIKYNDLKRVSEILDEYLSNPKQLVLEEYYDEDYLEKYNEIVLD